MATTRKTRSDKGKKRTTRTAPAPTPAPVVSPAPSKPNPPGFMRQVPNAQPMPTSLSQVPSFKRIADDIHSVSYADALSLALTGLQYNPGGEVWRSEFHGGNMTPSQCIQCMVHGWSTDRPSLDLPSVGDAAPTFDLNMDVEGAYPDIASFMDGDPECMVQFSPNPTPIRFAHLVVCLGITWRITSEELYARGKLLLAMMDSLEAQGVRVKLSVEYTCDCYESASTVRTLRVDVKDYQDPMDEAQMCFVLGHPAMVRTLMWWCSDVLAELGVHHKAAYQIDHGRGLIAGRKEIAEGEVYIPRYTRLSDLQEQIRQALAAHAQ